MCKLIGSGLTKLIVPSKRVSINWKSAGKQSGTIVNDTGISNICLNYNLIN